MIATFNRNIYLRALTGMLLILLIGFKITAPTFAGVKTVNKELSSATENDTNGEKKAENNTSLEKEKEFASIYSSSAVHMRWYTPVIHYTSYYISYKSSYYSKITIPPPDRF